MQLNEGSAFCPRCGAQVAPVTGQVQSAEEVSQKSRLAVTLLSCPMLYVGLFGAHRFYMGKIKSGVAMLLLGVAAAVCYFSYLAVFLTTFMEFDEVDLPFGLFLVLGLMWLFGGIAGIWSLIDFIIAVTGNFKDKQGKPIKKW
jgi:TM2 domain-containing membrane protein YozV